MTRILPTALVMGVIVGLLVAAYMNILNVPVMEWAIALEGCDIDRVGCAQNSWLTLTKRKRIAPVVPDRLWGVNALE